MTKTGTNIANLHFNSKLNTKQSGAHTSVMWLCHCGVLKSDHTDEWTVWPLNQGHTWFSMCEYYYYYWITRTQVDLINTWLINAGAPEHTGHTGLWINADAPGHRGLACHFPAQEATKLAYFLHLIHIFIRASGHMNPRMPWLKMNQVQHKSLSN